MTIHNVHAGEAIHAGKRFRPQGRLRTFHKAAKPNPATKLSEGGLSARLFVGLKVGTKTAWSTNDVVELVWKTRKSQKRSGDASILAQKGIYEDLKGRRIVEPSVQIIIIDFSGADKDTFTAEMTELGETLCKKLKQESVILEIQRKGVVEDVYSVTP